LMSFAGLAQAQRHRTISYNMLTPGEHADYGFYVPEIVNNNMLMNEWFEDLKEVSKKDFPQAQMVYVRERGNLEDFRSKMILRLCGHAQHEIMLNTGDTAEKYSKHVPEIANWIKPKCQQGMKCSGNCVWTGKKALERIV